MTNLIVWIALVGISALIFVIVLRADRALERRVEALEDSYIEDVLDAVDALCYPLDDYERENVKNYVKGE
jgi:hypothetical protein